VSSQSRSKSTQKRRAVVVLGMHRSGTSALTRVLGMGGATLPKTPMCASEFNARGYYESTPILDLHEEMLEALGTSWHDLSPLAEGWERSGLVAQFAERMAGIVLDEFGDAPLIAVKDPRICRLVPSVFRDPSSQSARGVRITFPIGGGR
jgi:hypothetical protein